MNYPVIDPIIVELGPVALRWYGLMYLLAFGAFYFLGKYRVQRGLVTGWTTEQIADAMFYGVVGVLVGGRVGFALFYGFDQLLADPLWLFKIWTGGMSFHGGLVGVIVALFVFAWRTNRSPLAVTDFAAPLVAPGLGLGRLGNFINAELPGRMSDGFGMYFPCDSVRGLNMTCFGDFEGVTRHVSSLYQMTADGIVLFVVVWWFANKARPLGQVSGCFLVAYGLMRIVTEFFREPDAGIGFVALDFLTMGQLLSIPMILLGVYLLMRKSNA